VTVGLIAAKAVPLKETAMVPLPPTVPVGTMEVKPTCGLVVTAHGSGGGPVFCDELTVKGSLLTL
jgi:hypothetical protein